MATVLKIKRKSGGAEIVRWRVTFKDNSAKWTSRTFERMGDAKQFAAEVDAKVASRTYRPERDTVTVKAAAERWIAASKLGRSGREPVERHTLRYYESMVRNHIVPALGLIKIQDLTPARVKQFRDVDMLAGGRSRSLTKKALVALSSICREAVADELIPVNPCAAISLINSGRHKKRTHIPTKEQVRLLLDRAREWIDNPPEWASREYQRPGSIRARWLYTVLTFLAATGVRISEARGATLAALDLEKCTFHVMQRADENGYIGALKSAAGRREIHFPPNIVPTLREWLKVRPTNSDLLFPNRAGAIERTTNIYKRLWLPLLVDCGLATRDESGHHKAEFTIHALRHFHASLMIEAGMDLKILSERMGHANISMTADVYGHLFQDDKAQAVRLRTVAAADFEFPGGSIVTPSFPAAKNTDLTH